MSATEPRYDSDNVMEFRTTQCKPCKILFDALKENITDVSVFFSSEGMKIFSVARSQAVLINVELDAEKFDHYYCRSEHTESGQEIPIQICISVHNVNKILKTITTDDDVLTWTYNPNHEYLTITINSSSKNEIRSYQVKLQDPIEEEEAGIVDDVSEYPYVLTMPCADFQRICRDLKQMNVTKVTISHQDNNLIFSSKSDVTNASICREGICDNTRDEDENNLVFIKVPETQSCYSGEFKFESLHSFSKCATIGCKSGKIVRIFLSPDQPIILMFNVGKLGKTLFVLAPSANEDE